MKNNSETYIKRMLNEGLLKRQKVELDRISRFLSRAVKDLATARANLDIDEEAAYTFAYLGMLRAGRALVFPQGFRPTGQQQHKTVVDFSGLILGERFKKLTRRFDAMRRKRHEFTYEPTLPVTVKEAKEALDSASRFVEEIIAFVREKNPQIDLL